MRKLKDLLEREVQLWPEWFEGTPSDFAALLLVPLAIITVTFVIPVLVVMKF